MNKRKTSTRGHTMLEDQVRQGQIKKKPELSQRSTMPSLVTYDIHRSTSVEISTQRNISIPRRVQNLRVYFPSFHYWPFCDATTTARPRA